MAQALHGGSLDNAWKALLRAYTQDHKHTPGNLVLDTSTDFLAMPPLCQISTQFSFLGLLVEDAEQRSCLTSAAASYTN